MNLSPLPLVTRSRRLTNASLATGGARTRTYATLHLMDTEVLFGEPGTATCFHLIDASGPLDAPEVMPAGSVEADSYGFRGDVIVGPTEFRRA